MTNLSIALLVCLVIVMFLWLLGLLGAVDGIVRISGWLAFFACLILSIMVLSKNGKGGAA